MTATAHPSGRHDAALFYSGLVAFTALLVFGALAVAAVAAMIVPGQTAASVRSGSMMPTLRVGDVVIGPDHDGGEIAPDTVVIYVQPSEQDLVTHRVVSVNPDGSYVTKGDATSVTDAPIPPANIRSVVRLVIPYVGLPRVWAAQRQWPPLILAIAIIALALWLARFALDPRYDPWPTPSPAQVDSEFAVPVPARVESEFAVPVPARVESEFAVPVPARVESEFAVRVPARVESEFAVPVPAWAPTSTPSDVSVPA